MADLLDRRDLLLDEAASTGATVNYLDDGTVQVNLGGVGWWTGPSITGWEVSSHLRA